MIRDSETPLAPNARPPREISLIEIVNVVLRHRRAILVLALLFAVGALVLSLLSQRQYEATVAFMPQGTQAQGGGIGAIARQFRVTGLETGSGAFSPAFYGNLLVSRRILTQVVETRYEVSLDGERVSTTLVRPLDIDPDEPDAISDAVMELRDRISTSTNSATGVVQATVTTPWPELSEAIAARMIELLTEFNVRTRQSQASEEARFVAQQLERAEQQLLAAEDTLKTFLARNRAFANSPDLQFEHDRLQRQVGLRHELYAMLSETLERARIDAVRNTPLLTVIDPPAGAARPKPRGTVLRTILALLIGAGIGLIYAFLSEAFRRTGAEQRDVEREFRVLARETLNDLRRPWRVFRRGHAGA